MRGAVRSRLRPLRAADLAEDEGYAQVCERLSETLATWIHETDDPLLDGPVLPEDDDHTTGGIDSE